MQGLEISGAVRPIYGSLGVKRLTWERPCHARNRAGYVVTLWVYVELEVNGYIERLYWDLKPQSNNPYLVTSTG